MQDYLDGGTIRSPDGAIAFVVPAGALTTTITNQSLTGIERAYRFSPDGTNSLKQLD
ncbi:hypothetical protein [Spirosoma panaciterrae]|uniref:hypothetical protein n=1 Tax=Spirosoma panaciterrae TaxID=496058 RepID=UPI0003734BD2|nr:hypothetical protein [Spirosoma panaciterrae]